MISPSTTNFHGCKFNADGASLAASIYSFVSPTQISSTDFLLNSSICSLSKKSSV